MLSKQKNARVRANAAVRWSSRYGTLCVGTRSRGHAAARRHTVHGDVEGEAVLDGLLTLGDEGQEGVVDHLDHFLHQRLVAQLLQLLEVLLGADGSEEAPVLHVQLGDHGGDQREARLAIPAEQHLQVHGPAIALRHQIALQHHGPLVGEDDHDHRLLLLRLVQLDAHHLAQAHLLLDLLALPAEHQLVQAGCHAHAARLLRPHVRRAAGELRAAQEQRQDRRAVVGHVVRVRVHALHSTAEPLLRGEHQVVVELQVRHRLVADLLRQRHIHARLLEGLLHRLLQARLAELEVALLPRDHLERVHL